MGERFASVRVLLKCHHQQGSIIYMGVDASDCGFAADDDGFDDNDCVFDPCLEEVSRRSGLGVVESNES